MMVHYQISKYSIIMHQIIHSFEIDAFLKLLLLMLLIYRNHYLMFHNNMKQKENFSDGKRL